MSEARQQVVYKAGRAQVEAVLAILLSRGLHPSTEPDGSVTMPWVAAGLGQVSVAVPESEVTRARSALEAFEQPHVTRVGQTTRRVGPRLLLATACVVAGTALGLFGLEGAPWLAFVGLACNVVGLGLFLGLLRRKRGGAAADGR